MFDIDKFIRVALLEDIGSGDITTDNLVDKNIRGEAVIVAKEDVVIAGLGIARNVFLLLEPNIQFSSEYIDGDRIKNKSIVAHISGEYSAILRGERTALNFLQRLSGIATKTRRYVSEIKENSVKVLDTRKTIPGWRVLEKYAVRIGGGYNHRIGLFDGVLIKDNHIAICGGIAKAIKIIKNKISHLMKIEVEVSSLEEANEAVDAGADIIMLDNMKMSEIKQIVEIIDKKILIEVSGGVTFDKFKELISTGINLISVGELTHSAVFVDLSMKAVSDF